MSTSPTSSTDPIKPQPRRSKSHHGLVKYFNPFKSARPPNISELRKHSFLEPDPDPNPEGIPQIDVVTPEFVRVDPADPQSGKVPPGNDIRATWLGHAGYFVQLPAQDGRRLGVIFDPIWSERAGPVSWLGPKRRITNPCEVSDLPTVDFVCISHSHYDHLDTLSIASIRDRWPTHTRYCVPLGTKWWFKQMKIAEERIIELDWWDEREFTSGDLHDGELEDVEQQRRWRITFVPAQHTSGRGLLDQNSSTWGGWVIQQFDTSAAAPQKAQATVYHVGDTGYRPAQDAEPCDIFKEIGEKFGSFDLTMIPIWRGGSLQWLSWIGLRVNHRILSSAMHASPADALHIHKDLHSRRSLACHYATFAGSASEAVEPLVFLVQAARELGVEIWWAAKGRKGPKRKHEGEGEGREEEQWSQGGEGFGWSDTGETVVAPLRGEREGERGEQETVQGRSQGLVQDGDRPEEDA